MKNLEKYKDEIINLLEESHCAFIYECSEECVLRKFGCLNGAGLRQWINEEYQEPIQLSHDEYVILKNIDEYYKWIYRGIDGYVYICNHTEIFKSDKRMLSLRCFTNLFKFIEYENGEYEIAKLIEGYEKEHGDDC